MEIDQLRTEHQSAVAAAAKAEQLKQQLIDAATRKLNLSEKYFRLVEAVIDDPVHNAYAPGFTRILERAKAGGIVKAIHGGCTSISFAGGGSTNFWYELGDKGVELMKLVYGPEWTYQRPEAK